VTRRLLVAVAIAAALGLAVLVLTAGGSSALPTAVANPAPPRAAVPRSAPAPAPQAPQAPQAPPGLASLPAATSQAVVVRTPSPGATRGDVSTWRRGPSGWTRVLGPVPASVGRAGTGTSSESVDRTPAGAFGLTRAFGRAPNPGTALPWFHAGPNDWWVSDARSRAYNTHQTCRPGTCPFNEKAGENLDAAGAAYDDAVVIDANTAPVVPGRGSAYFLHVGAVPTAGCVATDRATVVAVLRWLDPRAHPMITIGH
jgi:L,D-peptidoglycan transpeptidase YkuD (ErfK/YbiS/YcfS/YnhG family)